MQEWLTENWLWLAVVVYLAGMMLYCHYIGFMRSGLSCLTVAISIFITRLILPYVTGWISKIFHLEEVPVFRLNVLTFIIICLILMILLKVLLHATDIISSIPIIHGLNQIAGAFLGLVLGLVFLWIMCLIVSVFSETGWATDVILKIGESKFLTFLFDHNLIKELLKNAVTGLV